MSPSQDPKMSFTDFRFAVNLVAWLSHTLAVPLNVLMHFGCGERYVGVPGLIVVPLIGVYAAFSQPYGGGALVWFLLAYVVMCGVWRAYAVYRRKRLKQPIHTRYGGRPWLHLLMPRQDELAVKRAEPVLVMMAGVAVISLNSAVGVFLIVAGLGQAMSVAIGAMIRRARLLDQMDSMIEQRQVAQESRELVGG